MTPFRLASYLAAIGVAAFSGVAQAAPKAFVVDDATDLIDIAVGDGKCRTAAGTCTLRAAIMEANRWPGSTITFVINGIFPLTLPGAGEDLARAGDLDITASVTITGNGQTRTIIDAGSLPTPDRVFHVLGGTARFERLTVTGGSGQLYGTGIFGDNAGVELHEVTVRDNDALADGGGLRASGPNAVVSIAYSNFITNTAVDNGGGIALDNSAAMTMDQSELGGIAGTTSLGNDAESGGGLYMNRATATLTVTTVDYNTATDGAGIASFASSLTCSNGTITHNIATGLGGGLDSVDGVVIAIGKTNIDTNTAGTGGGIYWDASTTAPIMVMTDGTVSNNTASSATGGGGVYARHGTFLVDGTDIMHNSASAGPGGGLLLDPGTGNFGVFHAAVSTNTATNGGGIAYPVAGSPMSIERSTFDNNIATSDGGGIWAPALGTSTLAKSTISGNNASRGGGLWLKAATATTKLSILSTTIAYNTAPSGKVSGLYLGGIGIFDLGHTILSNNVNECGGAGAITSRGYNLFQSLAGCTVTTKSTDLIGVAPNLQPLRLNGGLTRTHAPSSGSVVIDGGSPTAADCSAGGATDQNDRTMPTTGTRCDIGSYETP